MRSVVVIILVFFSQPAAAFCYQGSDLSGALDYLVCLHNEQGDTLNDHARIINDHARAIDDLNDDLRRARSEISDLSQTIDSQRSEIDDLKQRVDQLEAERR